jgi:protein phosphatase
MGTTIVAVIVEDDTAHIAHIGDSRAYRLRAGRLVRLTKDHSLLQDYIEAIGGNISEEEMRSFPQRNVLTRAVGVKEMLQVSCLSITLAPGDRLLLCTDGLHGLVEESTLRDCLAGIADLDVLVRKLIELANGAGGTDNISALVLEYED